MNVKGNHPLAEILARKLLAIESVPAKEQRKMVQRAIKAAVEFHEKNNSEIRYSKGFHKNKKHTNKR